MKDRQNRLKKIADNEAEKEKRGMVVNVLMQKLLVSYFMSTSKTDSC